MQLLIRQHDMWERYTTSWIITMPCGARRLALPRLSRALLGG